jgi:hypothetical protein
MYTTTLSILALALSINGRINKLFLRLLPAPSSRVRPKIKGSCIGGEKEFIDPQLCPCGVGFP